ncbi:MAG: patatin-like phospholipase family protein [Caldilineaceae bacterium]
MRAFVLSGGGNLGPLQIGALRALYAQGIKPDILVGCSAGAINASQVARNPTPDGIEMLADFWRRTRLQDVYPGSRVVAFTRFVTGKDSLFDNRNFYALFQRYGMTPAHTFANMAQLPLFITATDLRTGKLHVFGDNPNDRILDALMSSTALTPFHPPWEVGGERYVDGGTVTPLPIRTALERGATEIYALHIYDEKKDNTEPGLVRGVVGVLTRSVDTMLRMQAQHDLLLAHSAAVKLHYIKLAPPRPTPLVEFGRADELADAGYAQTQEYLSTVHTPSEETTVEPLGLSRRLSMTVSQWLSPRGAFSTAAAGSKK